MKKLFNLVMVLLVFLGAFTQAQVKAPVSVFACEPEWGALASEIGGHRVSVRTATTARQDPHHITARPSLIAAVRKADLVFCTGAGLEEGWLPVLLQKSGKKLQAGDKGHLMASNSVKHLEVPISLDRSLGHVHAEGNPHVHLNPHNIRIIAKELAARLESLDNDQGPYYQARLAHFLERWDKAIVRWEARAKNLKDMPIAVHHKNWAYLADWLDLKQVLTLEPKPGVPPTVSHLEQVLRSLKTQPIKLIIHAPFEDPKPSHWLSKKAQVPEVCLPFTVGGNKRATTLELLFDDTLDRLTL